MDNTSPLLFGTSMFDVRVTADPPPKLRELVLDSWVFPVDYPIVNNTNSPDASRTLKQVIAYSIVQYYKDHRVCSYNIDYFSERLASRLYNKMSQHQYWLDQFLQLIADGQFFYNDEWDTGTVNTVGTNDRTTASTTNNTNKSSDTPQNYIGDINNYLSSASVDNGGESGTDNTADDVTRTDDLHIKKSTLGDITVQFRNFAEFPNFIDQLIVAVAPCFIQFYGNEDVDYGTA